MTQEISRSRLFLFWFKGYLSVLGASLAGMTIVRLLWFVAYNKGDELSHYSGDLLKALWLGLRFDLSALCHLTTISLILWLPWLILGPNRWSSKMLGLQKNLWAFLLVILSLILIADFAFYGFFQDHLNVLIFGFIQDDTQALIRTFWKNYPVIEGAVIIALFYWACQRWLKKLWLGPQEDFQPQLKFPALAIAVIYFLIGLGARGSTGLFPLEIMHTAISSQSFINALSFNGPHALVRAIQLYDQQHQRWNENLLQLGYEQDPQRAIIDFSQKPIKENSDPFGLLITRTSKKDLNHKPLPHVVVVLMESWGSDWMKLNSPTFNVLGAFAKHKKEDLFTPSLMPSNVATIGSLGSLLVDLPHRFYSPFLTESTYLNVEFSTAPARIFQAQKYQTHFIYGGNSGWRSIDQFIPRQGYGRLHAEADIKAKFSEVSEDDLLHDWGVYDEYVFKYAQDLLLKSTSPQFIFILTTSNHPPYTTPPSYKKLPLEFTPAIESKLIGDVQLGKERLMAFQYANQQLGLFLDDVKKGPLANRTLIAATGDHSFYIRSYENLEIFEKWAVPLYLKIPPSHQMEPKPILSIGSHIDIFPTLYNLIFSELDYTSLGQDLLNPNQKTWSFHTPSLSAFSENIGIIVSPKGEIVNPLCRTPDFKIENCPKNDLHELARKRLLSLIGTADLLFERDRKKGLSPK
ncbi:MAG: hypothetical protein RJB66_1983 [Pseudomonadota bacterium]|jgi:phosphoglycerol transferase MdoB-like AlkP superfamily enzyme